MTGGSGDGKINLNPVHIAYNSYGYRTGFVFPVRFSIKWQKKKNKGSMKMRTIKTESTKFLNFKDAVKKNKIKSVGADIDGVVRVLKNSNIRLSQTH